MIGEVMHRPRRWLAAGVLGSVAALGLAATPAHASALGINFMFCQGLGANLMECTVSVTGGTGSLQLPLEFDHGGHRRRRVPLLDGLSGHRYRIVDRDRLGRRRGVRQPGLHLHRRPGALTTISAGRCPSGRCGSSWTVGVDLLVNGHQIRRSVLAPNTTTRTLPCHSQHIAHWGTCRKTRVVPQNHGVLREGLTSGGQ